MKAYLAKQGEYFVSVMLTNVGGIVAAFVAIVIKAALPFSATVETLIETVLSLLISVFAIAVLAAKSGYEKRTFSLRFNAVNGLLFLLWHLGLSWVCQAAWFSSGMLHFEVTYWLCYAAGIRLVQGKAYPLLLSLLGVAIADALIILPVTTLGNDWGARKYRRDVREMQEDHAQRQGDV